MKNRNKQTKFPVARIKKIMQKDEEVGKVAQATPVVISKALELFLGFIVNKTHEVTAERGSRKVEAYHLKHAVETTDTLDFLKELVEAVPDPSQGGTIDLEAEAESKRKRGKGKRAAAVSNAAASTSGLPSSSGGAGGAGGTFPAPTSLHPSLLNMNSSSNGGAANADDNDQEMTPEDALPEPPKPKRRRKSTKAAAEEDDEGETAKPKAARKPRAPRAPKGAKAAAAAAAAAASSQAEDDPMDAPVRGNPYPKVDDDMDDDYDNDNDADNAQRGSPTEDEDHAGGAEEEDDDEWENGKPYMPPSRR